MGRKPEIRARGSLMIFLTDERLNHRVEVESGLLELFPKS